jgi:hypothetical protein
MSSPAFILLKSHSPFVKDSPAIFTKPSHFMNPQTSTEMRDFVSSLPDRSKLTKERGIPGLIPIADGKLRIRGNPLKFMGMFLKAIFRVH